MQGAVSGLWPQRKGHNPTKIDWDVDMYTVHSCLVSKIIKMKFELGLGKFHSKTILKVLIDTMCLGKTVVS